MNNKEINETLKRINEKELELRKEIQNLSEERIDLQSKCPHTIIIQASNHKPHKLGPIHTCFCPICEKLEKIYLTHEIDKTQFTGSKIINLTRLNYEDYKQFFTTIKNEILQNYSYYYNEDISIDELTQSIIKRLNNSKKYRSSKKLLTKRRKYTHLNYH